LIFSTLLTLIIIPCLYYLNERAKVKFWGAK
jgi:multidrug efflux pump subunit AcrB